MLTTLVTTVADRRSRTPPRPFQANFSTRIAAALCVVALSGCGHGPEAKPLCDAVAFFVAPDDATIVVRDASGTLRRIDTDGKALGVEFHPAVAPNDVVITHRGDVLAIEPRANAEGIAMIERWKSDGTVESLPSISLVPRGSIRPCLNGTATSGALTASSLALLHVDEKGALHDVLRLDISSGVAASWPSLATLIADLAIDSHAAPLVSIAPSGDVLALFTEHAGRRELRLVDEVGTLLKTIDGVEPVKPYWLANLQALLFVRTGGSISSLLLPKGEPVWFAKGSFTTRIARAEVTAPLADNPRVTVEKTNFEGFVQVCEVAPFEVGSAPEIQRTNGAIDHFGAAWSHDHRYLSFRQRVLKDSDRLGEERIVVLDRAAGFSANTVATRDCDSTSEHIGPAFMGDHNLLLLVRNGKLCRVDLDD